MKWEKQKQLDITVMERIFGVVKPIRWIYLHEFIIMCLLLNSHNWFSKNLKIYINQFVSHLLKKRVTETHSPKLMKKYIFSEYLKRYRSEIISFQRKLSFHSIVCIIYFTYRQYQCRILAVLNKIRNVLCWFHIYLASKPWKVARIFWMTWK